VVIWEMGVKAILFWIAFATASLTTAAAAIAVIDREEGAFAGLA
jgi:hypothetical protein